MQLALILPAWEPLATAPACSALQAATIQAQEPRCVKCVERASFPPPLAFRETAHCALQVPTILALVLPLAGSVVREATPQLWLLSTSPRARAALQAATLQALVLPLLPPVCCAALEHTLPRLVPSLLPRAPIVQQAPILLALVPPLKPVVCSVLLAPTPQSLVHPQTPLVSSVLLALSRLSWAMNLALLLAAAQRP